MIYDMIYSGFAFVEFELTEDAAAAMENMNDAELYGRVIKVNVAKPNAIKSQAGTHASLHTSVFMRCSGCSGLDFVCFVSLFDFCVN